MGWPEGVYRVAPLGSPECRRPCSTPLANEEFKSLQEPLARPCGASLYYHYARLIEDLYAIEQARVLCEDEDILSDDIRNTRFEITGEGVGVIEAPRGTLWHHYWTNDDGVVTKVNLIVATGNNNWAMNTAVNLVAKEYVDGNNLTEGMLNRVEAAIRCYDPCLSCSTHALGQMPLSIELIDSSGNSVAHLQRG